MKTLFTIFLATMAIATASAQNKIVKQNRQVAPFSAISASGGWDVIVRQGDRQSVSIEISESVLDDAIVEVKNGELRLSNNNSSRRFSLFNLRSSREITRKAYVTVTNLEKVVVSGGVDIRFATPVKTGDFQLVLSGGADLENLTLDCNQFVGQFSGGSDAEVSFISVQGVRVDASGGSDVKLRDISARTTRVSVSGGCDIQLTGRTDEFTVNASGGADVSAEKFTARSCNANFSGAADGSIRVTDLLDATVSGSADLVCFGNPKNVEKRVNRSSSLNFR